MAFGLEPVLSILNLRQIFFCHDTFAHFFAASYRVVWRGVVGFSGQGLCTKVDLDDRKDAVEDPAAGGANPENMVVRKELYLLVR